MTGIMTAPSHHLIIIVSTTKQILKGKFGMLQKLLILVSISVPHRLRIVSLTPLSVLLQLFCTFLLGTNVLGQEDSSTKDAQKKTRKTRKPTPKGKTRPKNSTDDSHDTADEILKEEIPIYLPYPEPKNIAENIENAGWTLLSRTGVYFNFFFKFFWATSACVLLVRFWCVLFVFRCAVTFDQDTNMGSTSPTKRSSFLSPQRWSKMTPTTFIFTFRVISATSPPYSRPWEMLCNAASTIL